MNGFSWSCFIFSGFLIWRVGEDTCLILKDKKTLEALTNVLAGAAPEKHQNVRDLLNVDPIGG